MMTRPGFLLALAASVLGANTIIPACAQVYPSHPITLVVPFPSGGPTDAVGRILAERMRVALGQPLVIENVASAGGNIGVGRVARALPDGYTLVIGNSGTHVVNGAMYTLQYDLVKDFEPISLTARETPIIVARKGMPARDLNELIGWLKANPNKALQATAGVGTPPHLAGILFQSVTNTRLLFVPYRGAAPAMQDLMAGQVDIDIDSPVTTLPQIRAGTIKAYAVAAKIRLAAAPDIPTVDEAGLPGFYVSSWFALFAPRGLPKDVTAKLNDAVVSALADPAVRHRIADLGLEIPPREEQTPEALGALQKADIERWWPIIKSAGIKAD
jgi:tripartite-type tricarboxylate transporter receptor subunit TctC